MQQIGTPSFQAWPLPQGDMLAPAFIAGEVVATATGRATTPFPYFDLSTDRKVVNSIRRAHQWLIDNACLEAQARKNATQTRLVADMQCRSLSSADLDALVVYLFDLELAALERQRPALLKPLCAAKAAWKDPTQDQPVWLLTYQEGETPMTRRHAFGSRKAAVAHVARCKVGQYTLVPLATR